MAQRIDLTGQVFGKITVIGLGKKGCNGKLRWNCICGCGKQIEIDGGNLRRGYTKSCGCIQYSTIAEKAKTHGYYGSRLYRIWGNMMSRCRNPKASSYKLYGGRGIDVCAEWENAQAFINWAIGAGYSDNLSIDRIDNDKGYSPDNCRWVTMAEQQKNRRNNKHATMDGVTKTFAEWAVEANVTVSAITYRHKHGLNLLTGEGGAK